VQTEAVSVWKMNAKKKTSIVWSKRSVTETFSKKCIDGRNALLKLSNSQIEKSHAKQIRKKSFPTHRNKVSL
jgi:hypothetical protein